LSFALVADNLLFVFSWAGNGASGVSVPRPTVGPINFAAAGSFFWLALALLACCAGLLVLVRDGTTGQELAAMRGSESGARAIGIDVPHLRIVTFALSASLAGIGGVLYGSLQQTVSPHDFNYQFSLLYVVIVAVVGVHTVAGAIEAGLAYAVLQQLVNTLPSRYSPLLAAIVGLAALTYVRHPEGVVAYAKRWLVDRIEDAVSAARRHASTPAPTSGTGGS
jgi:branched-chain amino acid transport system permease protein